MKVILTEDIKSLGKKGQIVDVSDGYARNFILKKKKGLEANSQNLNDLKLKRPMTTKLPRSSTRRRSSLARRSRPAGSGCPLRWERAEKRLDPCPPKRSQRK